VVITFTERAAIVYYFNAKCFAGATFDAERNTWKYISSKNFFTFLRAFYL